MVALDHLFSPLPHPVFLELQLAHAFWAFPADSRNRKIAV